MLVSVKKIEKIFIKYYSFFLGAKMYYYGEIGYIFTIDIHENRIDVRLKKEKNGAPILWASSKEDMLLDTRKLIEHIFKG